MTGEIEACATGCTTYHGEDLHYRAADVGHLCSSCVRRIRFRLEEAPQIMRVLRASVVRLRAVDTSDVRVDSSPDSPIPFDDAALEAADELFATLCNWAISHAQAMGAVGGLPAWLSPLAKIEKDARHLPAILSPQTAAQRVADVVEWLREWGDAIAWTIQPASLKAYHDDVVDLVRRMRGKAGLSEPRVKVPRRLCEVCGEERVEASVPDVGPEVVRCTSCHAVVYVAGIEWERAA